MQLLTFNPDHDLALAHGCNHYVPPASAVSFAEDAAAVLAWMRPDGLLLMPELEISPDYEKITECLLGDIKRVTVKELATLPIDNVLPWGWNFNLRERLKKMGVQPSALPDNAELAEIHRLSHRRTAALAMSFLRNSVSGPNRLPPPSEELHSVEEANNFLARFGRAVFKMPWSGSGRGLRRVEGEMSPHQRGWVQQSIRKYGCIMAEPYMFVVQDFAMEFLCDTLVTFQGYSLFRTHNGVYLSNLLFSDGKIEEYLSQWIDIQILAEYKQLLTQFIQTEIAPYYKGYVGVDMFVYQNDGVFLINPAVELNLRMTMGVLANRFCHQYMAPDVAGTMSVEYRAQSGELYKEHLSLNENFPPEISNGKLVKGHITLTPVSAKTHYTVRVLVS